MAAPAASSSGSRVAALPGDQDAIRARAAAGRARRARRGRRPLGRRPPASARGDGDPPASTSDRPANDSTDRGRVHGRDGSIQEPRLLGDAVDQEGPARRKGGREREARIAAAAADVDERVDPALAQERHRREAVEDEPADGLDRFADRGQVDRAASRPGAGGGAFDGRLARGAGGRRGRATARPSSSAAHRRGRELGDVLDAQRERFATALHLPPRWWGVDRREPLPASSSARHGGPVGLPWLIRFRLRSPGAPREPRYPAVPPCRADAGRYGTRGPKSTRLSTNLDPMVHVRG